MMPTSFTQTDPLPANPSEAGTLPSLPQASTAHAQSPCPHFGPCGGCQLQHLPYPAQLIQKKHVLQGLLDGLSLPSLQIHTADPWLYRNRIRLRVEPDPTSPNTFLLGYNRAQTNDLLPIHTCLISAPILLHTAQTLIALAPTNPTVALWLAATAQIELFTLPDGSALQLRLFLRHRPRSPNPTTSFTVLFQTLQRQAPQLVGLSADPLAPVRANTRASRPDRALAILPPLTAGRPGLLYPVPLALSAEPSNLWVSRPSFFQVNRHLLPTLLHTALASANLPTSPQKLPLAWDLFAGVGLFARALAPHFDRITAVESAPSAIADLRSVRLPNTDVVESTVLDFLRQAVVARDRPSLVLLDPPRVGLGPEAIDLLLRLQPTRIVYVSCDPKSLARDLRAMVSSRYILVELHMVDMFPQTAHLEAIAVLVPESPSPA